MIWKCFLMKQMCCLLILAVGGLLQTYGKGFGKKHQHAEIRDVFIASIAIQNDIRLCTLNKKHFRAIPSLRIMNEKQIW